MTYYVLLPNDVVETFETEEQAELYAAATGGVQAWEPREAFAKMPPWVRTATITNMRRLFGMDKEPVSVINKTLRQLGFLLTIDGRLAGKPDKKK